MDNMPDPRPVFEYDQVLTAHDLFAIRNGYIYQFRNLPWYKFSSRLKFLTGIGVCNEMLHWLAHGKPAGGVNCRGGQAHEL